MLGQPFQTRGDIDRIADQRIVEPLLRAHIADTANARVKPDPDLHFARPRHALGARHGLVQFVQFRDHIQRRTRSIAVMVKIIERGIPEREDRIANILVERRFALHQNIAHRREKLDQEIDHLGWRILL